MHKEYGYIKYEKKTEFGEINIDLRGAMKNIGSDYSQEASPYELLIWVDRASPETLPCAMVIDAIRLMNNGNTLYEGNKEIIKFRKKNDSIYGGVVVSGVDIDHQDVWLSFDYYFQEGCVGLDDAGGTLKIFMKTTYSEKKITFWDSLMGV